MPQLLTLNATSGRSVSPSLPRLSPRPASPYDHAERQAFELFAHKHTSARLLPLLPSQLKKHAEVLTRSAENLAMSKEKELPYPPVLDRSPCICHIHASGTANRIKIMHLHSRPIETRLPDDVVQNILSYLSYKELCGMDAVCTKWRRLGTVAARSTYKTLVMRAGADILQPVVRDVRPLKRLHVDIPIAPGATECATLRALMQSVLRRLAPSAKELIVGWAAMRHIGQCSTGTDGDNDSPALFPNVKCLSLILRSDMEGDQCQRMHWFNANQLRTIHLHIHGDPYDAHSTDMGHLVAELSALTACRHQTCEVNVELHCGSERTLMAMLQCFRGDRHAKYLKIISSSQADERGLSVSLSSIINAVSQGNGTSVKAVALRGVHLRTEAAGAPACNQAPIEYIRLSSCNMDGAESLAQALKSDALGRLEVYGNDALVRHVYDTHFAELCARFPQSRMDFTSPHCVYHRSQDDP